MENELLFVFSCMLNKL